MKWIPVAVLAFMGVLNLARGAIHAFAPDGGAHSIAGLDLTSNRETILALFATLGFEQIAKGAVQIFIAARWRALVPLFLGLQAIDTALALVNLYLWRPFPVVVPGQPFNAVLLVVQLAALWLSLPRREAASAPV